VKWADEFDELQTRDEVCAFNIITEARGVYKSSQAFHRCMEMPHGRFQCLDCSAWTLVCIQSTFGIQERNVSPDPGCILSAISRLQYVC
jgi:hypothetical protein